MCFPLKVNLALHDDDCVKVSEGLALQAANGAQLDNAKTIMTMIDSISNQDVRAVAAGLSVKIKCDQLALAVVGDIGQVPNEKELICPK